MGRKRIQAEPLTNAEKQHRYRVNQKAKIEALTIAVQVPTAHTVPDITAMREQIKTELKQSWEPELKAERIAAERKKGRELAKRADQSYEQGITVGICKVAAFFISKDKDRLDITRTILSQFMIDRKTAEAALQADKRTKDITLSALDKSGVWGQLPSIIK